MPSFFHKPENALKRAHEFIEVEKKESALDVLNDVIRSRKHRQKWTSVHQDIMMLYTKLCVQLQRSSYAKDGLYQYRNICKEVNPRSFELVIKSFLKLAEEKADEARQQSEATVLEKVEDLDAVVTPESLLLSTVSGEGAKERTDRVLLTPWVKFLWESYRNMLELLKNSLVNLNVYSDVAKSAFKFCLNYQRRMEFRKLCDILRNHLAQAEKYQSQQHSLKLDQPEVITGLVDVRFEQLESSIAVDMWQEAFRAIEEIHKLLNMSGKSPKASLLENFYSRQAKVYMMAKNQLFHAAALHKLFVLRKEQKKTLTKEEARITASQVMLATLSVPIEPIPSETDRFLEVDDNSRDKAKRLAALLRMDMPPNRAILMRDMLQHNVLQLLAPELQQLYHYLEVDFDPLHLCSNVMPILKELEEQEHLSQYVELLRDVTLVRLIKQVAQVYESIELSRLVELAPFSTTTDLERIVVETATSNNIQVRIDHSNQSLCFGTDMNFSHKGESPEGPYVQSMPSEILCSQLTVMSQALQQVVRIVSSMDLKAEQQAISKKACQDYQVHSRGDHRRAQQRGKDIEDRKEFIENQRNALKKQKEDERQQKLRQERDEETKRLDREAVQREKERVKLEIEEMQLKMKQEKVEALKSTAVGKRAFADITNEDLKNMDAEVIFSKQLKQIEKEKRDREIKLKTQEKKVDYFERAKCLVEIPLLEKQHEEQGKADREYHVDQENQKISLAIKEREEAEESSVRLNVMREDEARFRVMLQKKRSEIHEEQMKEFHAKLDIARAERLAVRRNERKERRKAEAEAARKEEEARQAKLKREEEERKREEEQLAREQEREEARLKQLQREKEAEEKMRQREEEDLKRQDDWRGGGGGGAYKPPVARREEQYDSPRKDRRGIQDEGERRGPQDSWRRRDDQDGGRGWREEGERDQERDGGRDLDRGRRPPRDDRDRDGGRDFDRRPPRDLDRDRDGGRGWRGEDRDQERKPLRDYDRGAGGRGWRGEGERDGGRGFDRGRAPPRDYDRDGGRGWRGEDQERDGGRDFDRDRRPPRDYDQDRGAGGRGWRGEGERDQERDGGREFDRGRRPYDGDRDGGRGWRGEGERDQERDKRPPPRDERPPPRDERPPRDDRDRGGWGREGGGDRWRDRDDSRGGSRGDGELRADDHNGRGWRGSDRSPGRDGDKDREVSPHRVDEQGFETVNRRR